MHGWLTRGWLSWLTRWLYGNAAEDATRLWIYMYIELGVKAATVTQNGLKIFTMQISGGTHATALASYTSFVCFPIQIISFIGLGPILSMRRKNHLMSLESFRGEVTLKIFSKVGSSSSEIPNWRRIQSDRNGDIKADTHNKNNDKYKSSPCHNYFGHASRS